MSECISQVKKRGRKPKSKTVENKVDLIDVNSETEPIIIHLPISLEDIVNISNEKMVINKSTMKLVKQTKKHIDVDSVGQSDTEENITTEGNKEGKTNNLFIKSESEFKTDKKTDKILKKLVESPVSPEKKIEPEKIFVLGRNINKVNVHNIKFKLGTKCLWCKYAFETPAIELPEDYFNNIFYCIGNFCSWNCAKAHNIDLNDTSTWKRESLLNLMFFQTYGFFKDITPAVSWIILEDYGGRLTIEDFRKLFILNNKDYIVLHPPLVTRQLQIEESYKKSTGNYNVNKTETTYDVNNSTYNVNKTAYDVNKTAYDVNKTAYNVNKTAYNVNKTAYDGEFLLKRSKPLETNNLNLEKTMGLKRKMKTKINESN